MGSMADASSGISGMNASPWRRVWRKPARPRHGHNWDDRPFSRDDEAGDAGALGVYGGVTVPHGFFRSIGQGAWQSPDREGGSASIRRGQAGGFVTSLGTPWEPREAP